MVGSVSCDSSKKFKNRNKTLKKERGRNPQETVEKDF
jgi:hypothetical protein